jgi:hypothetical protein
MRKKHLYESRSSAEAALWAHAQAWNVDPEDCEVIRANNGDGWYITTDKYLPAGQGWRRHKVDTSKFIL